MPERILREIPTQAAPPKYTIMCLHVKPENCHEKLFFQGSLGVHETHPVPTPKFPDILMSPVRPRSYLESTWQWKNISCIISRNRGVLVPPRAHSLARNATTYCDVSRVFRKTPSINTYQLPKPHPAQALEVQLNLVKTSTALAHAAGDTNTYTAVSLWTWLREDECT